MKVEFGIRFHFGLISMARNLPTSFGGLGVGFRSIGGSVQLKPASEFPIVHLDEQKSDEFTEFLVGLAKDLGQDLSFNLEIALKFPRHSGFGTGTQIRLAIVEITLRTLGLYDQTSKRHRISLAKRGGASGIGLRTYDEGGLILDLGRVEQASVLLPTSSQPEHYEHTYLPNVALPWISIVAIPKTLRGLSGPDEIVAFNEICPIADESVYAAAYYAVFGAYGAALQRNYALFVTSLRELQSLEWKRSVKNYIDDRALAAQHTIERALGIDMFFSSWGPAMIGFVQNSHSRSLEARVAEYNNTATEFDLLTLPPLS